MKQYLLGFLLLSVNQLGLAQMGFVEVSNQDSISFYIYDFKIKCDKVSPEEAKVIEQSITAYLSDDFLITSKNTYVLVDYQTRIQEALPGMDTASAVVQKWKFNSYAVRGYIYCNKIVITVTRMRDGYMKNITKKWSYHRINNDKVYRKLAKAIRSKLIQAQSSKLYIRDNYKKPFFINDKKVELRDKKSKIDIVTNKNQAHQIFFKTTGDNGNEQLSRTFSLDKNQMNYFTIQSNGKVKKTNNTFSLSAGFIVNKDVPHLSTQFSYALQFKGGIALGLYCEVLRAAYATSYSTFPDLPQQTLEKVVYPIYPGVLLRYNRFLRSISTTIYGEANVAIFPYEKYDIKVGFTPLGVSRLSIELGYTSYDIPTVQYTFNPFGNATSETVNQSLQNFYFGFRYSINL